MKKFLKFFLFILLISFSSPLFSEEIILKENISALDLKKALEIGFENSPELIQMEKELERADLNITIEWANFYPNISLDGGYDFHNYPQWNPNYYQATVGVDYTFYDYGRRFLNLKTAKSNKYISEENYRQVRQNKALEITSAFLSVLKNEELVNLAEQRLERAKIYYQLTQEQLNVGMVSYTDLLKSNVEVKSAESNLFSASHNLSLSKIKLENLLGLKNDKYKLDSKIEFAFPLNSIEEILSEALINRPEIKINEEEKIQLDYAYELTKKEYIPSLSLKGSYDYYLNRALSGYPETSNWSIYLGVKIPIFNAGISNSRLKQAQLNKEKIQLSKEKLIRDITGEVSSCFFNFQDLEKLIEVQDENVTAATESLHLATESYKEGVGSILEVIDAQTNLVSAETNKVNTLFDYQLAKANLILVFGGNIEDYLK